MALTGQEFDTVAPVLFQAKATAVRSCEARWPRTDAQPGRTCSQIPVGARPADVSAGRWRSAGMACVRQPSRSKNNAISDAAAGSACHQPSERSTVGQRHRCNRGTGRAEDPVRAQRSAGPAAIAAGSSEASTRSERRRSGLPLRPNRRLSFIRVDVGVTAMITPAAVPAAPLQPVRPSHSPAPFAIPTRAHRFTVAR